MSLKMTKSRFFAPLRMTRTLEAAGKPTELVETTDGSRVLLLPYGGRVLGLYTPTDDENFYWTNTALATTGAAREFFASDKWQNSGGDRTWLSPEVDVFLPSFPALDKYWQPRELDPGNYRIEQTPDGVRLVNRLTLTLSRSRLQVDLEIGKSVGPAPNPLRYERGMDIDGVEYAGYTQHTSFTRPGTNGRSSCAASASTRRGSISMSRGPIRRTWATLPRHAT
jgi:hypothetical protein